MSSQLIGLLVVIGGLLAAYFGYIVLPRIERRHEMARWIRDAIRCNETMVVPLSLDIAWVGIKKYFEHSKFSILNVDTEGGIAIYRRGDAIIDKLPMSREVAWAEVPVIAGVTCVSRDGDGETAVILNFGVEAFVRVSPSLEEFCLANLKVDINRAFEFLSTVVEQFAQDEVESAENDAAEGAGDSDFAALGLNRGASWDDVRTAYRECCMKFHPDRLTGQNVAPHLVDLAVRRFKEVNESYERLRDRLAPSNGRG
jgi:hypothetical protein